MHYWTQLRSYWNRWNTYKLELQAKNKLHFFIVSNVQSLLEALVIASIFRWLLITASLVPTPSMVPTLQVRDRLFVNKIAYDFKSPKRGDVVVFKSVNGDNKDYVKRCVGIPGDTIHIKKGVVYINNSRHEFPGVTILRDKSYLDPIKLKEDEFFMMGDNRANSFDSRGWGTLPKSHLIGKAWFIFWPFSRMQVVH